MPPPEAPGEDPSSPSLLPALQAAPASLGLWPHHSILHLCQHASSPHVSYGCPLLRTPVIGSGPPCDLISTGSLLQRPYLQRRPYTRVPRSGPPGGSEFTLNNWQVLGRWPGGGWAPHLLAALGGSRHKGPEAGTQLGEKEGRRAEPGQSRAPASPANEVWAAGAGGGKGLKLPLWGPLQP